MEITPKAIKSNFKVLSSICSNLAVVWFVAIITTGNVIILLRNFIFVVIFWYLAVKSEILSEND